MKSAYQSSNREGKIYIDYYKDENHTEFLTTLNIVYTYTYASSNPGD